MTAVQTPRQAGPGIAPVRRRRRPVTKGRILLHAFLVVTSLVFLFPLLYAVYTSLRPYAETAKYGYFSLRTGWCTSWWPVTAVSTALIGPGPCGRS